MLLRLTFFRAGRRTQSGGRFRPPARPGDHGAGDADALALAAGQFMRVAFAVGGQRYLRRVQGVGHPRPFGIGAQRPAVAQPLGDGSGAPSSADRATSTDPGRRSACPCETAARPAGAPGRRTGPSPPRAAPGRAQPLDPALRREPGNVGVRPTARQPAPSDQPRAGSRWVLHFDPRPSGQSRIKPTRTLSTASRVPQRDRCGPCQRVHSRRWSVEPKRCQSSWLTGRMAKCDSQYPTSASRQASTLSCPVSTVKSGATGAS